MAWEFAYAHDAAGVALEGSRAELIAVMIASVACSAFVATQIRTLRRRKRNLMHWEKDEPLEGVGDWD